MANIDEDPTIRPYDRFHNETIRKHLDNHYVKWLILGCDYEKAENVLIKSAAKAAGGGFAYPDVDKLLPNWKWADLFPDGSTARRLTDRLCLTIDSLAGVLMDNIKYEIDTPYSLRIVYTTYKVLSHILDSGRFAPAFFMAIRCYPTKYFIENTDYRDGTKYSIFAHIEECLEKLIIAKVEIPTDVREICDELFALDKTE